MESLWDEETGMYLNRRLDTGAFAHILTPFHFHALFSRRSKGAHAERMVREHLLNPEEFWGEYVLPSIARNHPGYKDNDYWRGPTWLNVAYFAAKGLKNYGFAVADPIRETILDMCLADRGGIYENYDSVTGKGLYCNHFSWSAVFIMELIWNF